MSTKFPLPQPFLRTKEAARFVGVSPRTLEKHRSYGTGPIFSKVGGRILYALSDLTEWVKRGAKRSTSDPATVLPPRRADKLALRSRSDSDPASDFDATQPDTIDSNELLSAPSPAELSRSM
jgi:hypothetical protein